ncbi:hypothetical protein [Adlercreutzia caecimuris]|uniref:hypothetical protein n=1 Tax=Adlercreutzia caecimuris TaxID=671266 RepID=UPI0020CDEB1B|nr:hypothetical protein [Adlercreutzia caecimuris]
MKHNGIGHGGQQRGRHVAGQRHADHQTTERNGGGELQFLERLHLLGGKQQDNEEQHAHAHATAGHKGSDGVTGSKALGSVEHVDARGPTREQRHQAHARRRDEHEDEALGIVHLEAVALALRSDFILSHISLLFLSL